MDVAGSVAFSQGCFLSRGRKKNNSVALHSRTDFGNVERRKMGETIVERMFASAQDIHQNAMRNLVTNIVSYIKRSHEYREDYTNAIPAVALITGINMTGYFDSVGELQKAITSSCHVAIVYAKNSPGIKAVMKCISYQLLSGCSVFDHNSSKEETMTEGSEDLVNTPFKSSPLVLRDIEEWYQQEERKSGKRKEIVIVIKDTEFFPSSVLQDLVMMLSGAVRNLPFVLVFCVAMPWTNVIDKQLPYSTICNLKLTKFYAPASSELLKTIIDEILLKNSHPFKLGGKSLQLLLDQFLCSDFSLDSFLKSLRYCVLEHFRNEPASILCTNNMKVIERCVQNISARDISHLRKLPSVQDYMEMATSKLKDSLMKSNKVFCDFVISSLLKLNNFHSCFSIILKSLYCLCKSLPCCELACSLRQLYCSNYIHPVTETVDYKRAMVLLRSCSRQQMISRLDAVMTQFNDINIYESNLENNVRMQNLMKMKTNLQSFLDDFNADVYTKDSTEIHNLQQEQPLEKVKYSYQLREELENRFKQKRIKEMSGFQKLREQVIDSLDAFFKESLASPKSFVMHEVYYFDSPTNLPFHFLQSPRMSVESALSNPFRLLNLSADNEDVISPWTPSTCIAYTLHRECGRIINMSDWVEAFSMIASSGEHGSVGDGEITERTQKILDKPTISWYVLASDINQMASRKNSVSGSPESTTSIIIGKSNSKEQTYSDAENPSPANKSPASSVGKQGKTSHQAALAQLDLFLSDISEVTEKVKKEEKKKLHSEDTKLDLTEENLKLHGEISESDVPRRWNSLQSVASDVNESRPPHRHISFEDIRSLEESDSYVVPITSSQQRYKENLTSKRATYSFASISSQGSDNTAPSTYGLQHLNHLCIFLEQFEQLQQQNTELSKRVSNLETGTMKLQQSTSEDVCSSSPKTSEATRKHLLQRQSASFAIPSNKPVKKRKGVMKPLKAKYLSTLLFPNAARSVENLNKHSSHNLEVTSPSYAVDDMELRKSPTKSDAEWGNSVVKGYLSSSREYSSLSYIDPALARPHLSRSVSNAPDIVTSDKIVPFNIAPEQSPPPFQYQAENREENDGASVTPAKSRTDELQYRNTKKMTEWAVLQQVFPTVQAETNLSLLSHLDYVLSSGKEQKRTSYLSSLKVGSGRTKNSTSLKNSNMFLPDTENTEFSAAFHAAHVMTSQLTLTMTSSEIELLSNHMTDNLPCNNRHNQSIPIP